MCVRLGSYGRIIMSDEVNEEVYASSAASAATRADPNSGASIWWLAELLDVSCDAFSACEPATAAPPMPVAPACAALVSTSVSSLSLSEAESEVASSVLEGEAVVSAPDDSEVEVLVDSAEEDEDVELLVVDETVLEVRAASVDERADVWLLMAETTELELNRRVGRSISLRPAEGFRRILTWRSGCQCMLAQRHRPFPACRRTARPGRT